jgi:hypothetical protein
MRRLECFGYGRAYRDLVEGGAGRSLERGGLYEPFPVLLEA